MKLSLNLISAFLGVASVALALPPKVTYDGVKVFRIDIGNSPDQVASFKDLVSKLDLALWGADSTHVDLEVPKNKLTAFRQGIENFVVSEMHKDLGASIRAESASTEGQCE